MKKEKSNSQRRDFLKSAAVAAVGTGFMGFSSLAPIKASEIKSTKVMKPTSTRLIFMPCIHLRREYNSAEGLRHALRTINELDPKPELIVTGGDMLHNLRDQSLEEASEISDLFAEIFAQENSLPVHFCLGNHDPAGWGEGDIPEDHELFGFNMLTKKLNMPGEYYSFDHGKWHFVVINNVTLTEPGEYVGEVSEEQLEFLRKDLDENREKPTMLFGHIPPITAIEFVDGRAEKDENDEEWTIGFDRTMRNPAELIDVMKEGNVKAFLSGHIHRLDRIEVSGQTFICSGSVSGDQWKGKNKDTEEGYGILDLYDDGNFEYTYHDYGWKAVE